jgi:ATP-dependent protease ClpP protease subunit|nr:MAG TPA: Putative ATP dependent Clp protease [Caudoviricetes sp.]
MNKFYNFISTNKKHELYVYGEIIGGSNKWDESDVIFDDFKNKLSEMEDNSTLDVYVNSPGGSVFTTQGIVAALRRAKDRGISVNAYIDGIGASCASWLPMVADNIYVYPQSIMMIHKPMSIAFGNSDQMKKEIDVLDKIENDVIIPLYMEKAKEGVTEEFLREKMSEETWFTANEISNLFNVTMLSEERKIACCADKNVLNRYSNVPKELLNQSEVVDMKNTKIVQDTVEVQPDTNKSTEVIENSVGIDERDVKIEELENTIKALREEKSSIEAKLNEANDKVISLNDKVSELQPIVEEYNNKLAEEKREKDAALLNEKKAYYKNKFEQLGARGKFESEEVQNLLDNCISDEQSMSKLNTMIVEMITVDSVKTKAKYENVAEMDNLLNIEEDVTSKYGFK